MNDVISAHGVGVRFGGIVALRDVSVSVGSGEIVGLIGPNGAGKSTLLDVLSGMRSLSSGRVMLGDRDISRHSATRASRLGIRRTFQRQQAFGCLTVRENVAVAREWRRRRVRDFFFPSHRWEEETRRSVEESIELCGLTEDGDTAAGTLPIGRVRLMELARALVDRPSVLLLDEPTSGLEESETAKYGEIVRAYADREGAAVVLVEHDVDFVMAMSDRVVVLEAGLVLHSGTPKEVQEDERVMAAYLGAPVQMNEGGHERSEPVETSL